MLRIIVAILNPIKFKVMFYTLDIKHNFNFLDTFKMEETTPLYHTQFGQINMVLALTSKLCLKFVA